MNLEHVNFVREPLSDASHAGPVFVDGDNRWHEVVDCPELDPRDCGSADAIVFPQDPLRYAAATERNVSWALDSLHSSSLRETYKVGYSD